MKPFSLPEVDPGEPRWNRAQAGIRTLLVGVLCLLIGLGLGALWQSRRGQQSAVNTEGEAPGRNVGTLTVGTTAVLQRSETSVDAAIIEEVKRQIPNFVSVSMEEGSQILRQAALKDLQAALSQMEGQRKEAEQRVAQLEESKSETEKQAALKELQRLQADQAAKLREFTTQSSAQIEALRQLKESAR